MKYLICLKKFMIENNTYKKKKNLENIKELVDKFKRRVKAEVRKQEEVEKKNTAKLLFG